MTSTEYAAGLRDLADWVEAHPDFKLYEVVATAYPADTLEEAREWAQAMKPCEKTYGDKLFALRRTFGPVVLRASFWRHTVCEKVVTGTRHVPARTIEATPALVVEAHDEEIVEWRCEPLLGGRGEDVLLATVGSVDEQGRVRQAPAGTAQRVLDARNEALAGRELK